MFDAQALRRLAFVRHVEIHDSLGSTNDRARELARDAEVDLPALVVARLQTAGRGRGDHTWLAADGALTFSLLLDPDSTGIMPASWPKLSLATAVAICDALAAELDRSRNQLAPSTGTPFKTQPQLAIKWPNDVLLDGRKVCGILIESPGGAPPAKNRLIVGVGINVNNSWSEAPRGAGLKGTALCDVTGRQHDLQQVLTNVITVIQRRLGQLSCGDLELSRRWQQLNHFAGGRVIVETERGEFAGTCVEIAADGALVVETPSGKQRFYNGSVLKA